MRSLLVPICVLAFVPVAAAMSTTGCATRGTAVRDHAAQELGCPSSSVHVQHVSGHVYSASGCGASIDVACYDPYESTGAHKGWADGATAGNRVRCESLLQRPQATTSAKVAQPQAQQVGAPGAAREFDRALAARLLAASAERARTCALPGGPAGNGRARITFAPDGAISSLEIEPPFADTEVGRCVAREMSRVSLPAFDGGPVSLGKHFDIPTTGAAAGATFL
jgi:hypothetical protein